MAYENEPITPMLRNREGMSGVMIPDEMRQPGRLRWMNQVSQRPMMMAEGDARGVIQKMRDYMAGRGAAVEDGSGGTTGTTAAPAETAPASQSEKTEAYTFQNGGKTYHRDANNQLWVLDPNGQWRAIAGLWED